ncbi:dihydrodipicolinate synthase family protein [Paenibacillus sp. P36]|uniref:dihydrodipicolinate synthase family protein n=1 Tax=Paenibacillus sp. P36 TaxID=3342538 RepID=UPI0038B40EEE
MQNKLMTGVLPALVTPLDQEGNVKTELAPALIDMYVKQQADGLYMLGWTGEGQYLSVEKRKQWAEAVLQAAEHKLPIFVHVGYNENLEDSIELAAHAEEHGAYAVASVGISEQATLQDNVDYFKRISAAAPNTPFYIYWVAMGKTLTGGQSIEPSLLLEAMKEVPTFRGIKFTDNNFYFLERFKKHQPDLNILTGADELAICSQLMGADGNIGALQAVTCYHHKVMMEKMSAGLYEEARDLQYRANEVTEAYSKAAIGNLPGIKLLIEEIFQIPVGYCSPTGPFHGVYHTKDTATELIETYRKNILVNG